MTETAEKLFREALGLPPNERVGLVEELLKSLDAPDQKLDDLWAQEAEERLRAYRAGEIESHSADELFTELSRV